ncbi:hypothetical protein AAC387_Pa12g1530 [Persea americana]
MATISMSSWSDLLLVVVAGITCLVFLLHGLRGKGKVSTRVGSKKKLPPGPRGLPILGSLPMLGPLPHQMLCQWAIDYGPIMCVKMGQIPTIIVSSPQAAQQFLKTHDLIFASRPVSEVGRIVFYNFKATSPTPYGPYWRNARKLCTLELLSNLKVESFKPMRREEMDLLVKSIKDAAEACETVDLSNKVASLTRNMTCRMVLGKKYEEDNLGKGGFKAVIEEHMWLAGAFNIAECIPSLRALDILGIRRRMKAVCNAFDEFLDKIIEEHLQTTDNQHNQRQRDFVDFMLSFMESADNEFQFDRTNIKAILVDLLLAGMDTSSTATEWALSELIKHLSAMKKAQQELETVVGRVRMVDESDLVKLDYLDMVVKESMRLHPPAPFLLPRESMEDCRVNGFHIPRGTRLMINAWAIGRDPDAWPNPEEFNPERFIGTQIDVRGHDFQLVPFGSGRRGCVGMQLGLTIVRLILAQLIHCFDWELSAGMSPADLDMREKFSLVMPRANHLLATPTYRLSNDSS